MSEIEVSEHELRAVGEIAGACRRFLRAHREFWPNYPEGLGLERFNALTDALDKWATVTGQPCAVLAFDPKRDLENCYEYVFEDAEPIYTEAYKAKVCGLPSPTKEVKERKA